jgi:uncharacterized protein YjbI with pentapeptide repeats
MDESEIQREKFGDEVNSLPEKTRKSSRYTLWIAILIGAIGAAVFFSILPTVWWPEWLSWVGIGPDSTKSVSIEKTIQNEKIVSIKETSTTLSQSAKTFWDWLGLFGTLAVPVLIVILGYELQRREQERAEQRAEAEKSEAKQRADLEREIAATNLREEALQAYLDRMSELLLDKKFNISSDDDSALDVARTRTLTVLRRLDKDGERKGSVIQFLFDAGLLGKLDLTTADLTGVNLKFVRMNGAYLKAFNLAEADLSFTQLKSADLRGAFLGKAILDHTELEGADMQYTTLKDATLKDAALKSVYLEGADMSSAKLEGANLKDAMLKDAHLSGAILRNANLENADLEYASLDGADLASAILRNANLDGTSLDSANLGSANLKKVKSLTQEQVKKAKNWEYAHYDLEFRRELGLPPEPKE